MPLTLTQFLLLVITLTIVVGVTFLVTLMIQLRRTLKEGEKTLADISELVRKLQDTNQKIQTKLDDFGEMITASKKTVLGLSEITWFLTTKIIRPSSKYWPLLFPLLRFGWRRLKKRKEDKNGK